MENRGIDPRASPMRTERSTIWASSPGTNSDLNLLTNNMQYYYGAYIII
jgi:hypothetical protein